MKFTANTIAVFLVVAASATTSIDAATNAAAIVDLPGTLINGVRRHLNFNGLLGSPTRPTNSASHTSYEKVMGHPVFQVTTSWGSAYMNMEELSEEDNGQQSSSSSEGSLEEDESTNKNNKLGVAKNGDEAAGIRQDRYRAISLYYMDPDDAIGAHAEFKQMDGMQDTDVRVTTVSLVKAIRSAANLGRGMLTGQPIDYHKGTVLPAKEGGSLRHKIMPPKKQLYYAARCHGRERIGLFSDSTDPAESRKDHEVAAVIGNSALAYRKSQRKQANRDRKLAYKPKNQLEADHAHMDGNLGIPVFYAPGMERRKSRVKSLVSGAARKEIPLFFNYEDLERAWQKTTPIGADKDKYLPNEPLEVEVFNLWDVLTSMEKDQARRAQARSKESPQNRLLQSLAHPFQNRFRNVVDNDGSSDGNESVLDSLVFIPSSDACTYKEGITARGNGKARLRPMR
uniref:Uncharacterized protein n=1 Tax=Pseudo-nitzschia australis TaxID=44445 RepID=A0A7S4ARI0_9STRA|mmetsp:Transcript_3668/g.7891  ORF Transcript_3668/g.7891 Transcript_3668/m.7891 type:complete len:454 (-) Transcript_3668:221-1582(-)